MCNGFGIKDIFGVSLKILHLKTNTGVKVATCLRGREKKNCCNLFILLLAMVDRWTGGPGDLKAI